MAIKLIKTYTGRERWRTSPDFVEEKKVDVVVRYMAQCTRCQTIFENPQDREAIVYHRCIKSR